MKRNNKYEKIISAATSLISAEGYEKASLRKIADKVGLQKSSLFYYLKGKQELLPRIIDISVDEVIMCIKKINANNELEPEEKLKRAFDTHLILMTKYFDSVNIYLNQTGSLSKKNQRVYLGKKREYEKEFEKIILKMKRKGYFKKLNTRIVCFGLLGMLNWVTKWYKADERSNIKEISNVFYKIIVERN